MKRLLRFLSCLALDTLKGIGYGCLLVAFATLVVSAFMGVVWLMGAATLHSTPIVVPASASGSPEMNIGVMIVLGLISLGFVGSIVWEIFKAVRQRWREAGAPHLSEAQDEDSSL